jgi:parallel beta-helix repeat protein
MDPPSIQPSGTRATTHYVGSLSTFSTIQAAVDAANPGDTIIVSNATFTESVTVTKSNLHLKGNSSELCRIFVNHMGTDYLTDFSACVNITAVNVEVTGFNLTPNGEFTNGVDVRAGPQSNTYIHNNSVHSLAITSFAIHAFQTSNLTIENNVIVTDASQSYGICLSDNNNDVIIRSNHVTTKSDVGLGICLVTTRSNNISYNTVRTIGSGSNGILTYNSSSNEIVENDLDTTGLWADGVSIVNGTGPHQILNNSITTSGEGGEQIFVQNAHYNTIVGNDLKGLGEGGCGIYFNSSGWNSIQRNTIDSLGVSAHSIFFDWNFHTPGPLGNNSIVGNRINVNTNYCYGIFLGKENDTDVIRNNITTIGTISIGIGNFFCSRVLIEDNAIDSTGLSSGGIGFWSSKDGTIVKNTIHTNGYQAMGIYLGENSPGFKVKDNSITTVNTESHGIYLNGSSNGNVITRNTVTTWGLTAHCLFTRDKSYRNIVEGCTFITKSFFAVGIVSTNSEMIVFNSTADSLYSYDLYTTSNGHITVVNCSFDSLSTVYEGGGTILVKNFLDIEVYFNDGTTPMEGADVEVKDGLADVYTTVNYGGVDPKTNSLGRIKTLTAAHRYYDHSDTPSYNVTNIRVKKTLDVTWEGTRSDVDMSTNREEVFVADDIELPDVPTNLTVRRIGTSNSLNISFDHAKDATIYSVYTNSSGEWSLLTNITFPLNWTIDIDLQDEMWYHYKVRSVDDFGLDSAFTPLQGVYLADITPPMEPMGLKAAPIVGADKIQIDWDLNQDDTSLYRLYWVEPDLGVWEHLADIDHLNRTYVQSSEKLVNGTSYRFRIMALDKVGLQSGYSDEASCVHRDYLAPDPPGDVVAETLSRSSILLKWSPSAANDLVGYQVYINGSSIDDGNETAPVLIDIVSKTDLSYNFSGLEPNTTYQFALKAFDEANNTSEFSLNAANRTLPPDPPGAEEWISIDSPQSGDRFTAGENITISGSSSGLEGKQVQVNLGDQVLYSDIGGGGVWSVVIPAPDTPGVYDIIARVGNVDHTIQINITSTSADDDIVDDDVVDDDDDTKRGGSLGILILVAAILLFLIIIIIVVVIVRKRRGEGETSYGIDDDDVSTVDAEEGDADLFVKKDAKKIRERSLKKGELDIEEIDLPSFEEEIPDAETLIGAGEDPYHDLITDGEMEGDVPKEEKPLLALPPAQIFTADFADLPRIDEIFIMTTTGMLLRHFSHEGASSIDEDILSSMITVVQGFVSDSFDKKKKATLKEMRLGEFNILIVQGKYLSVVILSSEEDLKPLEGPTKEMMKDLETINEEILKDWDGNQDAIIGIEKCIDKMVHSGY